MLHLTLANGKPITVGAAHIQAMIGSGSGDGTTVILGGGVSYEVRQLPDVINAMIDALNGVKPDPAPAPTPAKTFAAKPAAKDSKLRMRSITTEGKNS